jgi:uncharacterized protein (UPF0276 family)
MSRHSAGSDRLGPLGVGITYSEAIVPLLDRRPELFPVVEIEPQTTWMKTGAASAQYRVKEEVMEHLLSLPGRKLIHSVGTPVGGSVRPEPAQLVLLQDAIERFQPPWISDHLSFNRTPEFATGFFLPPRQTAEGVSRVVTSICDLQRAFTVPVAVETGVNYLKPRLDELRDGEFVRCVAEAANCGLLLDLHNVFTNALNGRQPLDEFLSDLPLERVWEVHLAGGMELDGFWLDAHSGAIPDALYSVAEQVIPRLANLRAIIFEIFPSFVPVVGLELVEEQMHRLHALWARRCAGGAREPTPASITGCLPDGEQVMPEAWERALGALVTGQPSDGRVALELREDPGIEIIRGLVYEFRASMIVGTLRLTSRLLMLALGPDAVRTILLDYSQKVPPQAYGLLEAEAFGRYLHSLELQVPHLAKVLEFEQATLATLADDQRRVVSFDVEPLPLLRALAEGRLPSETGETGRFEIELTADAQTGVGGRVPDSLRTVFPFH